MALLRAVSLAFVCFCLLGCPPRGGGQLVGGSGGQLVGSSGGQLLDDGLHVPLLPDGSPSPEPCPQNARDVTTALGLKNPTGGALAEIDANQRQRDPLTVFAGPVESVLVNRLGPIGGGSRFYGRIWISKRGVVIRYYHAQMPNGDVFPICAVARRDGDEMKAKPGAYPGSAELEGSGAWIWIVEDFR